jgi:asparagine synthase (glutamine-hydrolysing)
MGVLRREYCARFDSRYQQGLLRHAARLADLKKRLYEDVFHNSLPALLRYEDRNSMAFSIEARTPFLDYRIVNLAFSMPLTLHISEGWTKYALRQAMDGIIPKPIQWRKDKMGFVTPEGVWLRAGRDWVKEVFSRSCASAEYIDIEKVRVRLDSFLEGTDTGTYYTDVFRWLTLELWMREVLKGAQEARRAA